MMSSRFVLGAVLFGGDSGAIEWPKDARTIQGFGFNIEDSG